MIAVPKRREDYFRNFFASQKRKLKRVCQKFRLLFHNHPSRPTRRSCPPWCRRPRAIDTAGPAPSVDCWVRHNSTAIIVEEAAPTRAIRIEGNVRNSMGIVAKHVVPQHSASSMSPGTLQVRVSSTSDTKAAKEAVAARKLFAAWVWLDALVAVFRRLALGEAIFEADLVLQQTRKRRRGRRHNRGVINET